MKYLLDSNVLRELGKSKPHQNVSAWFETVDDADLSISALIVREVTKGVAKLRARKPELAAALDVAVAAIFDAFEGRIWPIDRRVATAWGEALGANEKHVDDAGLAATALVHGLTVVTRNIKDFDGRGVKLVDPFKARRRPREYEMRPSHRRLTTAPEGISATNFKIARDAFSLVFAANSSISRAPKCPAGG